MIDARLRVAAIALATAGVAVAGYLTYIHYADLEAVCVGGGGGCERVQASDQSKLMGVPVAVLGLLSYVVLVATNVGRGELFRLAAATTALVGFGFSVYLTHQAVTDIGATCQWCLLSLGLMTALAVVTVARVLQP